MKGIKHLCVLWMSLIFTGLVYGQSPGEKAGNPYAVATYESAGIYWQTPESGACKIRYKATNSSDWKEGLDLVFDERQGEYRGSIVGLMPNREYQVELTTGTADTKLKFTTRNIPVKFQ